MKRFLNLVCLILPFSLFGQNIHHKLAVEINIPEQKIDVTDSLLINSSEYSEKGFITFYLNTNLEVSTPKGVAYWITLIPSVNTKWKQYQLAIEDTIHDSSVVVLWYSGKISGEIVQSAAEYSRGFSETDGIISTDGIYMAGSTIWIPEFDNKLFTFDLTVTIDKNYEVVSQGKQVLNQVTDLKRKINYVSDDLMDEIYLVASKWTVFEQQAGNVLVLAYLRNPDKALADRYLSNTAQYLEMYNTLIGPYPYSKFALVENFWETGYGMPSFTLLGEKVIRFPWILTTSYPHELLHNYWGNSVYLDDSSGNWCEGITSYMADHLMKEKVGEGAEYRRTTLQKFTDYVNPANDFPLKDFKGRTNPADEAIGYGKCLMMNHMLRMEYGDQVFKYAYADFYENNKFKRASYDDIRKSFEKISGANLESFFNQWVNRTGAPTLKLKNVMVGKEGSNYVLTFSINQVQTEDVFSLKVPVAIYLEGATEVKIERLVCDQRNNNYRLLFETRPLKLEVDPEFDVFRRLDKNEMPPTLSRVYGSNDVAIIIPRMDPLLYYYEEMAKDWKTSFAAEGKNVQILNDKDLGSIPKNAAVWVFGYKNKVVLYRQFYEKYLEKLDTATKRKWMEAETKGTMVYVLPNPENPDQSIAYLGFVDADVVKGLTSKLPHYSKYSYLGFEGKVPTNTLKGNFEVINSPLSFTMQYASGTPQPISKLPKRKALSQ